MSIVVPNISEIFFLNLILGKQTISQGLYLRLFKNALTPSENTTLNEIQESDHPGYNKILLSVDDWSISTNSGTTTAVCLEKEFVFTSNSTIYGYYVTTTDNIPLLMWVERFSINGSNQYFETPATGGVIKIIPRISLN